MKKAIIYARVSTDDQAENGYSLPTQLEAMREYARLNGFTLLGDRFYKINEGKVVPADANEKNAFPAYVDDYSGAKLDRPALDLLRAMMERKEADAVIVYAADRLSRNLAHLLILREEFNRAGIELHYVNRGKSENTAESRLMENMEGVIAEFEREKIRERTRRGKIAKARAGKYVGNGVPPYPFKQVGKAREAHIQIDESQKAIALRIVDMFLGRSDYKPRGIIPIAKQLTADNVPTARGRQGWRPNGVRRLLADKALLGIFERQGTVLEFPELALVDRDTWGEIQATLEQNTLTYSRNRKFPYLFSGFIKCICGHSMTGKPNIEGFYYYKCRSYKPPRYYGSCKAGAINVEILEPLVWNWLVSLLTDDAKLEKGLREMIANRETELVNLRTRRSSTENLIRRAGNQISQLTSDLRELESDSARASLRKDIDMIGKEKDSLLVELAKIDTELETRGITEDDIETIRKYARQIRARLEGKPNYEQKRILFRMLGLKIEVRRNETGRELFVQCGLKLNGETLPLPSRKNYVLMSQSS